VHRSLKLVVLVACLAFVPSLAAAQVGGSDMRLGLGMVLDFGGEVELENDGPFDNDDELKLTPGIRAHLDYDLGRYVSVGGGVRLSFWEGDDVFEDRNMLFDILARINGHYDWRDFRFYGALTIGPTISRINDGDDYNLDNPAVGIAVSIAPGVEYWFSNRFGAFLEMFGWSGHYFSHDVDVGDGDLEFRLNQVVWQLGINIAL
jgi:hypothetical protein